MAFSFHRAGPLRLGPFVHVDCGRDEPRLASALQASLADAAPEPGYDPVRAAWCGTLFLDSIERLPEKTQRLLLCFAQRAIGGTAGPEGWVVRLAAGSASRLDAAVDFGRFLPELHDELDKIRVDLERIEHAEIGAA